MDESKRNATLHGLSLLNEESLPSVIISTSESSESLIGWVDGLLPAVPSFGLSCLVACDCK